MIRHSGPAPIPAVEKLPGGQVPELYAVITRFGGVAYHADPDTGDITVTRWTASGFFASSRQFDGDERDIANAYYSAACSEEYDLANTFGWDHR